MIASGPFSERRNIVSSSMGRLFKPGRIGGSGSYGGIGCHLVEWVLNSIFQFGGISLNTKAIILSVIFSMMLISVPSLAQLSNQTADVAPDGASSVLNVKGIWILPIEDIQVTMVIYQSGNDLFGACTSEDPEPWNAVVMGSLSGDLAVLNTVSLQNGVLVSMKITGTISDGAISGSFIQADSNGIAKMGDVMGFSINPDTSAYEPAIVAEPVASAATSAPAIAVPETSNGAMIGTPAPEESISDKKAIVDVTSLSERIFTTTPGFPV